MSINRTCSIPGCDKPVGARGWCSMHYFRWQQHGDPLAGRVPNGQSAIEFERLVLIETDDCILWPHFLSSKGYGQIKGVGVHVMALERRVGPKPQGLMACHSPMPGGHPRRCMNYRHLRWDSYQSNQMDRVNDGTSNRGERHGMNKLTRDQVTAIRSSTGVSHQALADQFGISRRYIGDIIDRRTWKWLAA